MTSVGYSMPSISRTGLGIDDGDDLVGIRPVTALELAERAARDVEIALRDARMSGESEDVDLYRAKGGEIDGVGGDEVRAGGEGEVVDVLAVEAQRLGAVGVRLVAGRNSAGSYGVAAGER